MRSVEELLAEYEPITIFLGLPKLLSGEDGGSAALVEAFAEQIATISDIPIVFIDERLSTVSAARKLQEAGKSAKDSKSLIDSMSAVLILESGLANEGK